MLSSSSRLLRSASCQVCYTHSLKRQLTASQRYSTATPPAAGAGRHASIAVDEHCIPLQAPYSVSALLDAPPRSTPASSARGSDEVLDRATLLKLHELAALDPPHERDSAGWAKLEQGLRPLVRVMQAVKTHAAAPLIKQDGELVLVDSRVRAPSAPISIFPDDDEAQERQREEEKEEDPNSGVEPRRIVELASVTQGGRYFVARTPSGVQARKTRSTSTSSSEEIDE